MRDLSHSVRTGMTVYPGDPGVVITPSLTLERDGVAVAALRLGSHSGTHLDAPAHTVPGGRTTGSIGLDELAGEALVVHLPPRSPRTTYGLAALDAALSEGLPDRVPAIVVVHTGWARHFDTAAAVEHPALEAAAAEDLIRRGMHVLAVDTLSPDPTVTGQVDFPVHTIVLGRDRLIVENLTNLDGLPERVHIGIFPLAIDADGSPVRAVAIPPFGGPGEFVSPAVGTQ
ncbi:cyclase family protein [Nakamurella sp. GG22]